MRRQPLAQALHAFYSSHGRPHPHKVETLHTLTGSRNNQMSGFKRQLQKALQSLVDIGFLNHFAIEGSLVTVDRAEKPKPAFLLK